MEIVVVESKETDQGFLKAWFLLDFNIPNNHFFGEKTLDFAGIGLLNVHQYNLISFKTIEII